MAFGRLQRPRGDKPMSDINVTPLVDVMLVLVVIFILTAPLMVSAVRLDLPRTGQAQPADVARPLLLAIDAQGAIFLDNRPQTLQALAAALAPVAAEDAQTEVQLRADTGVPYGRVVEVMGEAQKAGLNRIGFVADPAAAAAPVPAASQ